MRPQKSITRSKIITAAAATLSSIFLLSPTTMQVNALSSDPPMASTSADSTSATATSSLVVINTVKRVDEYGHKIANDLPVSINVPNISSIRNLNASDLNDSQENFKGNDNNYWTLYSLAKDTGTIYTATYQQLSDFSYSKNDDGTYTVTGYTGALQRYLNGGSAPQGGYSTAITIPDTYNNMPIVSVADNAFDGCSSITRLTSITMGKNIKRIGKNAFANNNITGTLYIPSNVITIDNSAFTNNGINAVTLNKTLISIGVSAFSNNQINTSVIVPDNVTTIGNEAFCHNLIPNVSLDDNLETIGTSAFSNNQISTKINIPKNVTNIGDKAFYHNLIPSISLNNKLQTIGTSAFQNNQISGNVSIPNSVSFIGNAALANNKINFVKIGNHVNTIGNGAFKQNQINNVDLGTGVVQIGSDAFSGNLITSLIVPDSVELIGDRAFILNQLSSLTLGNHVQGIGTSAFENGNLHTLIIPDSTVNIGDSAFANNNIKQLTWGKSVKTIGSSAFINNALTNNLTLPNSVVSIGTSAFENNDIGGLNLGASILNISDNAFKSNNLTLPNSVVSIGTSAFENNDIGGLNLGASILNISDNAFKSNNLQSINSKDRIANIGNGAFSAQKSLTVDVSSTETAILDIKKTIQAKLGLKNLNLNSLNFTDLSGAKWSYSEISDSLTPPGGKINSGKMDLILTSSGAETGQYGTIDLVLNTMPKQYTVTIHYQNQNRETIAPDDTITGKQGDTIDTTKNINGYIQPDSDKSIVINGHDKTIIFVYTKAGSADNTATTTSNTGNTGTHTTAITGTKTSNITDKHNNINIQKGIKNGAESRLTPPPFLKSSSPLLTHNTQINKNKQQNAQIPNPKTGAFSNFFTGVLALGSIATALLFRKNRK